MLRIRSAHIDTNHLIHGECLQAMQALPEGSVDMVMADLPYGTTEAEWDKVIDMDLLWESYRRVVKPNGAIVLTASQPFTSRLVMSNLDEFRYSWVWRKSKGTGFFHVRQRPLKQHEDVCVFYRKAPTYNPQKTVKEGVKIGSGGSKSTPIYGGIYTASGRGVQMNQRKPEDGTRYPISVLDFASEGKKVHETQKPVDLMRYFIRTYTNPGDVVLDNTMGSGTTGVAATLEGRKFIGIEQERSFFDLAVTRIVEASNQMRDAATVSLAS